MFCAISHCCCSQGNERAVRLLLELGANPSGSNTGSPALYLGVEHLPTGPRRRMVQLLLQHGADCLLQMPCMFSPVTYFAHGLKQLGSIHPLTALFKFMAHLERQRAAGQLELGNAARALRLLQAAIHAEHHSVMVFAALTEVKQQCRQSATAAPGRRPSKRVPPARPY